MADEPRPLADREGAKSLAQMIERFKELASRWEGDGEWPEVSYDNDTGPDDGGFWQWWEIAGLGKFDEEEDAEMVRLALTLVPLLLASRALTAPAAGQGGEKT